MKRCDLCTTIIPTDPDPSIVHLLANKRFAWCFAVYIISHRFPACLHVSGSSSVYVQTLIDCGAEKPNRQGPILQLRRQSFALKPGWVLTSCVQVLVAANLWLERPQGSYTQNNTPRSNPAPTKKRRCFAFSTMLQCNKGQVTYAMQMI